MQRSSIAIIGPGRLGSALAKALRIAGYRITEMVSRRGSSATTRSLARSVGANATTSQTAMLNAVIVWFCVPDSQIAAAARQVSHRNWKGKIALHSSGVLSSGALAILRSRGASVASVHPLMTFVRGGVPDLAGVSFATEGDAHAARVASEIVRYLGGRPVRIRPRNKVAYHAFATMICPLLISLLAASEEAAALAGISARNARKRMIPIIRQTIANYENCGSAKSFTGPIVRGDVETIRRHLGALAATPDLRDVYAALVRVAQANLPNRNATAIREALLEGMPPNSAPKSKSFNRKVGKGKRKGR